jgi:hypothetical protein
MIEANAGFHRPLNQPWFAALLAAGALWLTSPAPILAGAQGDQPLRILPPEAKPYGLSYGEWCGAWTRWAYGIPADINPILDLTGENAAVGQSGPVWFLAGTFGGPAERTVTIPAGKAIFFPIGQVGWVNTPEFGDAPWSPEQEAYARGVIAELIDGLVDLTCQIDGHEVTNLDSFRFQTPPGKEYFVTMPENSIWLPAGTYGPAVDDGYWLMLAPLPVGHHTIHFTAALAEGVNLLDVTYQVTVVNRAR